MALVGVLAGLSLPSVTSGLDSLRLRSASDGVVAFLNTAIDRANRRQQPVEIWISPAANALTARSADPGFERRLDVPAPIRIVSVVPPLADDPGRAAGEPPRRFLLYPGGALPRIGVEIANQAGRRRLVFIDPVAGSSRSEVLPR